MEATFDLTVIWAGIIGFGLMMYVLMDDEQQRQDQLVTLQLLFEYS